MSNPFRDPVGEAVFTIGMVLFVVIFACAMLLPLVLR